MKFLWTVFFIVSIYRKEKTKNKVEVEDLLN